MHNLNFDRREQQMRHNNTSWRNGEGSRSLLTSLGPDAEEHRSASGRMQHAQKCWECCGYTEEMMETEKRGASSIGEDEILSQSASRDWPYQAQDIVAEGGTSASTSSYARPRRKRMTPRADPAASGADDRRRRKGRKGSALVHIAAAALGFSAGSRVPGVMAQATAASSTSSVATIQRWGAASCLVSNHFIVHGGKTQGTATGGGGYTYTSGPSSSDLLMLDMSQSFQTASTPWIAVNVTSSGSGSTAAGTTAAAPPATAFHTCSVIGSDRVLLFGGEAPSTASSLSGNDSAYILTLSSASSSSSASASVASLSTTSGQPSRRQMHAAMDDGGNSKAWLVGGERTDGSGLYIDETWVFDDASQTFTAQPSQQPPLTFTGIVDATLTRMNDSCYLALGGSNATGSLQTLDHVSAFDPSKGSWSTISTVASNSTLGFPTPRRGHIAVVLPNQRIFLHGGASVDMNVAYGDAWLLDMSASPPTWSQVSATGEQGAPAARYGHSAVAYGSNVVLGFGWAGTVAADPTMYVFDATSLVAANGGAGGWTGGSWSTSYTPSSSGGNSGGSSGNGNSGGDNGSSSNGGSSSAAHPSHTAKTTAGSDPSNTPSNAGQTAGAIVGALIGVGLIMGAAYVVHRRRTSHENWRRGDGAAELLGGGYHDDYYVEKGQGPGDGDGAAGGGMRNVGQTGMTRLWSAAGGFGHAIEGSGPALKEKFALLTGIGLGASAAHQGQTRFNMLADEDDEDEEMREYPRTRGPRRAATHKRKRMSDYPGRGVFDASDDLGDDDNIAAYSGGHHLKEISYGRVAQNDFDGDDDALAGAYTTPYSASPFDDAAAARRLSDDASSERYAVRSQDTHGASSQSHATSTTPSSGPTFGTDSSATSYSNGPLSFSDAQGSRRVRGPRASPSVAAGIKRSPTWWNRLTGGVLERSASGRLLQGPGAVEPIRDPAQPPSLAMIVESPVVGHSQQNTSEGDPFADRENLTRSQGVSGGLDEMGRPIGRSGSDGTRWASRKSHMKSLSSVQTATSSMIENQIRGMDVVQRMRTGSSNDEARRSGSVRTHASSEASSVDFISRNPSLQRGPSTRQPPSDDMSTPGSVVWDPNAWRTAQIPAALEEEELDFQDGFGDMTSGDIALGNVSQEDAIRGLRTAPSEAESFTPATTKRARNNPLLTAPLSPVAPKSPQLPLTGSVKERAHAFERKFTGDENKLSPVSPLTSPKKVKAELSPATKGREKVAYVHGLVPKAQLFVANPDWERGSSS